MSNFTPYKKKSQEEGVLISACLLGRACRYDGKSKPSSQVSAFLKKEGFDETSWVPVCPEELGELGTPRPAAQLRHGDGHAVWQGEAKVERVDTNEEVTPAFLLGAQRAAARSPQAQLAILKARSPSCGCGQTMIDGYLQEGDGVFAALLRRKGLELLTEEELIDEENKE